VVEIIAFLVLGQNWTFFKGLYCKIFFILKNYFNFPAAYYILLQLEIKSHIIIMFVNYDDFVKIRVQGFRDSSDTR